MRSKTPRNFLPDRASNSVFIAPWSSLPQTAEYPAPNPAPTVSDAAGVKAISRTHRFPAPAFFHSDCRNACHSLLLPKDQFCDCHDLFARIGRRLLDRKDWNMSGATRRKGARFILLATMLSAKDSGSRRVILAALFRDPLNSHSAFSLFSASSHRSAPLPPRNCRTSSRLKPGSLKRQ